jgi:hypothetical protein
MSKLNLTLLLLTLFLFANCKTLKRQNVNKNTTGTKITEKTITPKEYVNLLGKGMDVDWVKTEKGRQFYTLQMVKDFKKIGLSHVRIRIMNDADDKLLKQIDKVVIDCLNEDLIPVIAYQGADFKGDPTEGNLNEIVLWWRKVAEHCKDYPAKVSFDLLIECTEALNDEPEMLNQLFEKAVTEIRQTNPTRIIFISPRVRSSPEYLNDLKIPTAHNNFLMCEWHFYASGPDKTNEKKKWTTGTEAEKELIREKIRLALAWEKKTGIETWVGAWMAGNYNKGDDYSIDEQVNFANFVTCELTKNNIPFAFNSDVKFYDRLTNNWIKKTKPVLDEILKTTCK